MTIIEQKTMSIISSMLPEIAKQLKRIADNAENSDTRTTCCICRKKFSGHGNNPWPIMTSGECCDECNNKVIAARIVMHNKNSKNNEKKGE